MDWARLEVIGKRGFNTPAPLGEVGNDLWSLCYSISPSLRKTRITAWSGLIPVREFPVGASIFVVGDLDRAGLTGPKNPECFRDAFGGRTLLPP